MLGLVQLGWSWVRGEMRARDDVPEVPGRAGWDGVADALLVDGFG